LKDRHRIAGLMLGLRRVDQAEDVGVLEVGGGLDFLEEPLAADDSGQFGAEHFKRDLAIVLAVSDQVDRGHAARTELSLESVAIREGRPQGEEPSRGGGVIHPAIFRLGGWSPTHRCGMTDERYAFVAAGA